MFFCAIEEELRQTLKVSAVKELSGGLKDRIKSNILSSDDVKFYWCMLCTDAEEEAKEVLLPMIVDLWVTVRGFSFTRSWMEMFKQASKKDNEQKHCEKRFIREHTLYSMNTIFIV